MLKPDISAKEIFGLLDEVGFVEKLFWTLPPGILLSVGSTSRALADRFGYPGRHMSIAIENAASLRNVLAEMESGPIYFVGDVESYGNAQELDQILASAKVSVVNVLRELYPTWCAALSRTGQSNDDPARTVAIICPARSGSTYLSSLLTNTGQLGNVTENLRHHTVALTRTGAIDFLAWWSRITASATGRNGVFVSKIIHDFLAGALETMDQKNWRDMVAQTQSWKLITIKRPDAVERAVSVFLAASTGTWQVHDDAEFLRLETRARTIEYDFETLARIYRELKRYDALAQIFIAQSGGADLELDFDDIIDDGAECALRVVDLLGLDRTSAKANLARIGRTPRSSRTERNKRFADRFREDIGQ
jgi:LPS sulfotransferase NodH